MESYTSWSSNKFPAHLSVGAVLFDKQTKKICCHHFTGVSARLQKELGLSNDLYLLMRETPRLGESTKDTITRGLMEEFGATGQIVGYLGSIKSQFDGAGQTIEKTTIYFLVERTSFDPNKRSPGDEEKDSVIEWQPIQFLIGKMREQQEKMARTDLDEIAILERAVSYLKT